VGPVVNSPLPSRCAASACFGSTSSSASSVLAALRRQELPWMGADGQQERMRLGKRKRKNRAVRRGVAPVRGRCN
jgi:hypothetical protein